MRVKVTADERDGLLVVTVAGQLDLSEIDELDPLRGLSFADHEALVLDVSALTFVDCAGLGSLISLVASAHSCGTPAVVWRPTPFVHRLMQLLDLTSELPVVDSDELADIRPAILGTARRGASMR